MSEIAVLSKGKTLWIDYLPTFVVCGTGSPQLTAVSTEDGALNVYSPAGRRCALRFEFASIPRSSRLCRQVATDTGTRLAVLLSGSRGRVCDGDHRVRKHSSLVSSDFRNDDRARADDERLQGYSSEEVNVSAAESVFAPHLLRQSSLSIPDHHNVSSPPERISAHRAIIWIDLHLRRRSQLVDQAQLSVVQ